MMFNIDTLTNSDFYFNGRWLSQYNGIIAGVNGMNIYSLTPQLEIKTEKVLGKHGELVYNATYQPRTFTVPVYFKDITKIRDISNWLCTTTPQDFYFKGDKIKIKCMFDSAIDITAYAYQGIVELKFIAHNPFFTAVNDLKYKITHFDRTYALESPLSMYNIINVSTVDRNTPDALEISQYDLTTLIDDYTSDTMLDGTINKYDNIIELKVTDMSYVDLINDGNKESYPLLKVYGYGDITVSINGNSFTLLSLIDYAYVDMLYCTVYRDSSDTDNMMNSYRGSFFSLNSGYNSLSISGACTSIEIQTRSEWI